jgi:hypothetical protein
METLDRESSLIDYRQEVNEHMKIELFAIAIMSITAGIFINASATSNDEEDNFTEEEIDNATKSLEQRLEEYPQCDYGMEGIQKGEAECMLEEAFEDAGVNLPGEIDIPNN